MGSFHGSPERLAFPGRVGSAFPKFKSAAPPCLLLDSPLLFSSSLIFPSPTTGAFPPQSLNCNNNHRHQLEDEMQHSDFSFTTNHTASSSSSSASLFLSTQNSQPDSQSHGKNRTSDDGYNWRKYGQKLVKGSVNPRSYYKCTFPNCPTKKKVERSLVDGCITEIVYKGSHNHRKPQSTRGSRPSVPCNASQPCFSSVKLASPEQSFASHGTRHFDSAATPENSTVSFGDDDFRQNLQRKNSRDSQQEFDEDEHGAKRWKREGENEGMVGGGSRNNVKEARVVVQTTSDIDILDDGYKWRKYGQKVVKGNPNPRSYYKCTFPGCSVRKHVERAFHDARAVITTYEGKHNHQVPTARGSNHRNNDVRAEGSVFTPMLQNPVGLGNQTEHEESVMLGRAKQEARDESVRFLESLLA